jgi:uncharacterized membrane protein
VLRRRATLLALAGVTALDAAAAWRLGRSRPVAAGRLTDDGRIQVRSSIRVNATPAACYGAWRKPEQLPRWMGHIERVEPTEAEGRSRWIARGPGGSSTAWDVETVREVPGSELAWRSMPGSMIETEGSVRFERDPSGRGTLVHLDTEYRTPAGAAWHAVAVSWNARTDAPLAGDLRRFKAYIETGEIPTTAGQPSGPRGALGGLLSGVA